MQPTLKLLIRALRAPLQIIFQTVNSAGFKYPAE